MGFFKDRRNEKGDQNECSFSPLSGEAEQDAVPSMTVNTTDLQVNKCPAVNEICCEIDSIPDFLQDHRLVDKELLGRLKEHCRKWTTIVNGLQIAEEYDPIWWLRYRYVPSEGRVYIGFFGRLSGEGTEKIFNGIRHTFKSFGIDLRDIAKDRLEWWKSGIAWKQACVINQREELINTSANVKNTQNQDSNSSNFMYNMSTHYLINPWWGPGGTFSQPFDVMIGCREPVEIGICLQPCRIKKDEKELLELFAAYAKTAANAAIKSPMTPASSAKNIHDPNADWLSRISIANCRRLDNVFLCSAFVLSSLHSEAYSVAKSIESVVNEELPFEPLIGEDRPLFSRASVRVLSESEREELVSQYRSFNWFDMPSPVLDEFVDLVQKQKEDYDKVFSPPVSGGIANIDIASRYKRIRYMVDPRGASTLFRFPVSVNSGVSGIDVRQRAPSYIPGECFVSPGDVPETIYRDNLLYLGRFDRDRVAVLPVDSFRQHALITGFTGSGKTQTVLHLLHQFWNKCSIPFLVIESAKKEYRGLIKVKSWTNPEKFQIYTPGNSSVVPFRLNPFELLEGVRVELHISRLMTCFEAAFPQLPYLTSIMYESIINIYAKYGWQLDSIGVSRDSAPVYPTFSDFIEYVESITEKRGYTGESRDNVNAAIQGRLKILQLGSLGRMLDCRKSVPMDILFSSPAILEMNDLNEDNKSLITMFLLVFLREYRELNPKDRLEHITVVEEAHNILERTGHVNEEISADSKAKAVSTFCNMLTELRSYGEGLIIADQSPNKLAPDVMRNTNVQIAHQLRDSDDREAIANAMIMTEEQRDFIGKLRAGHAAVFYTGLERATFLTMPQYYNNSASPSEKFNGSGFGKVSDAELSQHMSKQTHCRDFDEIVNTVLSELEVKKEMPGTAADNPEVLQLFDAICAIFDQTSAYSKKIEGDNPQNRPGLEDIQCVFRPFYIVVLVLAVKCFYAALKESGGDFKFRTGHISTVVVHLYLRYNRYFDRELLEELFRQAREINFNQDYLHAAANRYIGEKKERDFFFKVCPQMLEKLRKIEMA